MATIITLNGIKEVQESAKEILELINNSELFSFIEVNTIPFSWNKSITVYIMKNKIIEFYD